MDMKDSKTKLQFSWVLLGIVSVAFLLLFGYSIGVLILGRISGTEESAEALPTGGPTASVLPTLENTIAVFEPTPTPEALSDKDLWAKEADPTPTPAFPISGFTDRFWQDGSLTLQTEYRSPDLTIYYKRVYDTQTFHRRITYFIAELFVSDVTQIKTASCVGGFNKNGHGDVERTARQSNAIVAISGDYYGFRSDSLVIRNGVVYRTKLRNSDICMLLRDGTMETIEASDANINYILKRDPWQAWQFGPVLLGDGGIARSYFPNSSKIRATNPRSCIGYIEPGHYLFVVVDGRQKYSKGVTLEELAYLMETIGCVQAYNLDGGDSAHFYWLNEVVSSPSGGGREVSDIIYIEKESYPVSPFHKGKKGL